MKPHMQFPIAIKIIEEEDATDAPFVAYIPEFDLSSCGKTEAEAVANVKEALGLLLEETKDMGTQEELLESLGLKVKQNSYAFPKLIFEQFTFA